MTVTADSFRKHYREFADPVLYDGEDIDYYIGIAYSLLNANRWGNLLDYGIELWVAHNLALSGEKKEDDADLANFSGPTTSQHVGEVGFTSSPQFILQGLKDIGLFAKTTYGIQYWQMAEKIGAGGVQI